MILRFLLESSRILCQVVFFRYHVVPCTVKKSRISVSARKVAFLEARVHEVELASLPACETNLSCLVESLSRFKSNFSKKKGNGSIHANGKSKTCKLIPMSICNMARCSVGAINLRPGARRTWKLENRFP